MLAQGLAGLPAPTEEEEVDEQLAKCIKVAHSDNPAQRSVEPIERLMETINAPSYTEYVGLILASQEAPTMAGRASLRMRIAVPGFTARFADDMLTCFDSVLKNSA